MRTSAVVEIIAGTVLASVLVSIGTVTVLNLRANDVQAEQIAALQSQAENTALLIETLHETNRRIDVLNERLNWVARKGELEDDEESYR